MPTTAIEAGLAGLLEGHVMTEQSCELGGEEPMLFLLNLVVAQV
jgi:hypothetical protein